MQRVQSPEAQQGKTPNAESLGETLLVVCGDDEAAQYEKEVDEQVTVRNQAELVQVAVHRWHQVVERHQACGEAAPAVEGLKPFHARAACASRPARRGPLAWQGA